MFSAVDLLNIAIQFERNGEKTYRLAMEKVEKPELAKTLEKMIAEEIRHEKWFEELKKELTDGERNPIREALNDEILKQIIGDWSVLPHRDVLSAIDDTDELLKVFVKQEEDTILFFETLRPLLEAEEDIEALNHIIGEENRHIELLKSFQNNQSFKPDEIPAEKCGSR